MASGILQVRDIPEDVLRRLRERAAEQGVSLSAYVRDLLTQEVQQPTMTEVIARVARRRPVEATDEEILSAIHEGRR
jgi:antitoxin FitA